MLHAIRAARVGVRSRTLRAPALSAQRLLSVDAAKAEAARRLNERMGEGMLPATLGFRVDSADGANGVIEASMEIQRKHLAPNGFCHAASIIALADSACGAGTFLTLPPGAKNFTTIQLASNFLGTATSGQVRCEAKQVHGGRSTQVWDATVRDNDGKPIALFRCTQMILSNK